MSNSGFFFYEITFQWASIKQQPFHRLGAYGTNALFSGRIFVRFNDLEDVFT